MNATTNSSKGWWKIECRDAEGSWSEETVGPDLTRGQALAQLDACGLTPLKIRFCDGRATDRRPSVEGTCSECRTACDPEYDICERCAAKSHKTAADILMDCPSIERYTVGESITAWPKADMDTVTDEIVEALSRDSVECQIGDAPRTITTAHGVTYTITERAMGTHVSARAR